MSQVKRVSGSQQCVEGPGGIRTAIGRVRRAEFLVPDLSGCKCARGLNRQMKSRGAHTCFGRWLMATEFGLLRRGNRNRDDKVSKECPEQISLCAQPGQRF